MTLQWTTIEVPLGAGLDTKTNEKLLKPPHAADLSDAIFPASGVAGYETRKGYDRIRTNTELTSIDALATRDRELLVLGNRKLYSVSELTNNVDIVDRGELLAVGVSEETLDTQAVNQTLGQIVEHNGVRVHCWFDSGTSTIQYTTSDADTGTIISADNSIANSTKAKLAYTNNSILLIYYNSSATSIRCTVIPTYAPTTTSDVEVRTDAHSDGIFDCVEVDGNEKVFVVYKSSTNTNEVWAFLLDEAGVDSEALQWVAAAKGDIVCCAAAIWDFGFNIIVATATEVNTYSSNDGHTTFGTIDNSEVAKANCINLAYTISRDGDVENAETHHVWAEFAGAAANLNYVEYYLGTGFSDIDPSTNSAKLLHASIASSAFQLDSKPYVHLGYDNTLQRQYFLYSVTGTQSTSVMRIHGRCCVGIGGGNITPHLPRVINGIWAPVFNEKLEIDIQQDDGTAAATGIFAQSGLKRVAYDTSYRPTHVEYGRSTYINSGILWEYDGRDVVEQGFLVYPELAGAAIFAQGTAGSLTQLATYSYRVYYEWTNAQGERQRSTTSSPMTVTLTTTNDDVTLTLHSLSHTSKGADVSIVVYRTEGNPNILGGAPFYRVSSPDPSTNGNDNGYIVNDITASTIDFTDKLSDADLVKKELDYLNTGELDNLAPISSTVMGESKNRVWLGIGGSRVQHSKLNSRLRDQLEFHEGRAAYIDLPEEDGDVTAFGALNFHTVVFKENSAYAISGEGPNNLGVGFFNLPQIASLDVGCIEQRSVVNYPGGLIFQSKKGLWTLGHNLDMKYIGAPVELYNGQTITAATVIPADNHIIFLTSSGSTLCFNYLVNAWSRFTNHEGVSAVLWNGVYTYARNNGKVYRQGDTYADDGVHYSMRFVTAPIGLKGVQGKQKIKHIKLLGEYYNPHNLRVGLRFNHEPGQSDVGTWDPSDGITVSLYGAGAYGAGAYGGSGSPVYQTRFNMPRQKCQTVQFIIDTTNTGGAGRAMSIQAIQIEAAAMTGTGELSVDSSFSATGGSTT